MRLANIEESGVTVPPDGCAHAACPGAATPHPPYRILLHHDGQAYVAEVPELPSCRGVGETRADALAAAEQAMATWLQETRVSGAALPALLAPAELARNIRERLAAACPEQMPVPRMSPVKLLLVKKFGKMSNRELAGRIGLSGRDAPTMLSAAASGKGTRRARCAIALALNAPPSRLWPERPPEIGQDDDRLYLALRATADARPASPA
ncbi:type II toxin-antitoxin system HicB family antitoxin [Noviherbaspirillum sedimenti]|uniref:type II toxin-antitoxin system HicB family antitoxin n=1 Tax=Noviherbaspirillum sedimenti TaxID=2320865 RepID=UPI0018F4D9E5|nr:hypothetical protein [Noviherbaspirillum sedimenti]